MARSHPVVPDEGGGAVAMAVSESDADGRESDGPRSRPLGWRLAGCSLETSTSMSTVRGFVCLLRDDGDRSAAGAVMHDILGGT